MSAPTPAPGDDRPREGYYPDPSIPGYVRYWNGASWVPGTSRPAPAGGEPLSPPSGAPAPAPVEETGPHFFDEDPVGPPGSEPGRSQHGSRPEPASAWGADRARQSGFGGDPDRRVSWGTPDPRTPAPAEGATTGTEGTATIPPADAAQAGGNTFVFRRPTPGPAAVDASRPAGDEGTMTFRALSPRTGAQDDAPGAQQGRTAAPSGGSASAGAGGAGAAGFGPAPSASGGAGAGAGTGPGASAAGGPAQGFGPAPTNFGPPAQGAGAPAPAAQGPASQGPSGQGPTAQAPAAQGPVGQVPSPQGPVGHGAQGPLAQGPAGHAPAAHAGAAAAAAPQGPGFAAGKAAAERAQAAAPTGLSGPQAAPSVPQQSGPQPASQAPAQPAPAAGAGDGPPGSAPVTTGVGGGQPSWAQQVHRLAGASDDDQPVAPWKPPVEDVFQAAARRQAAARPASLGKRFAARLLDTVVLLGVTAAAAVPLGTRAIDHVDAKIDAAKASGETVTVWLLDGTTSVYLGIVLAVLLVFGALYEALPTAKWGRTLGKRLFGLEVRDIEAHEPPTFGGALRRWLVYSVPGLLVIGVVGVLWCLFDKPWRQCWHDKAAHTFVTG
ncbi:RDD family protein [Streptomyces sp. NPDC058867]|uniref:RDD family protein n=1 Tax=unclassified Streptomyces TaxID=2593676 RepID=UPI00368C2163